MHFSGLLYRALNPVWSNAPLSGAEAARYGGRFNTVGRPTLYTSLTPETALREANQVGALQPTMLVAYRADLGPLLDGRDAAALARFRLAPVDLADSGWRERMLKGQPVPTQDLADEAIAQGFVGIVVPSYARGAPKDALNLVLWDWDRRISLIDDDDRLGLQSS